MELIQCPGGCLNNMDKYKLGKMGYILYKIYQDFSTFLSSKIQLIIAILEYLDSRV